MENKTDLFIKQILEKTPLLEPSFDFTQKVMMRIDPSYQTANIKTYTNLPFRTGLAISLTIGVFAVVVLTSDFAFTDTVLRVFSYFTNLNFGSSSLFEGMFSTSGATGYSGKYAMISIGMALAGGLLFMLDRFLGKKMRNTSTYVLL